MKDRAGDGLKKDDHQTNKRQNRRQDPGGYIRSTHV